MKRVRYRPAEKYLEVQYAQGEIYEYPRVTPAEYRDLLNANSIGAYLNQIFKPKHPNGRKIRK